jgi:dipeptidase D
LFYQTNPKLDLLSFGPTLLGVHSPKERLNIESTNQVANYLRELLKTL